MFLSAGKNPFVKLAKFTLVTAILFYLFMTFPILEKIPVTMDEVLFAEPARNFIEKGHFGTTSLSGLYEFETKTYWQHPLYMMMMYFPIKVFGFNCWSIKVLSALIGFFSLISAYKVGRQFDVPHLFPIILVFNVFFIYMARIGRMEMLSLFLSLLTFYFAWDRKPLMAGIVSSLALLNHPIGGFTVLNAIIVLRHRTFLKNEFFLAVGVPLLVAGTFVLSDLSEFLRQYYTVQHYLYDNSGWLGGPLLQFQNFFNLLVEARQWMFWLIPLFLLTAIGLKNLRDSEGKLILFIQAVNFLGLVLLVPNKYINYYVALVLPFTALYAAYAVKKYRSGLTIALLIILIVSNGLGIAKGVYQYQRNNDDLKVLENCIRPGSVVLAQPSLGIYLEHSQVVGFHNVRLIMDLEKKSAEAALSEINPDYVIVDTDISRINGWPLFTHSQDQLGEFIKKNTLFQGRISLHDVQYYIFKFKEN